MLKFLFLCTVILKALDILTTYVCVVKFGIGVEINPLVRLSIKTFGLDMALAINFLVSFGLFYISYKQEYTSLLVILSIILAIVVANNFINMM